MFIVGFVVFCFLLLLFFQTVKITVFIIFTAYQAAKAQIAISGTSTSSVWVRGASVNDVTHENKLYVFFYYKNTEDFFR